MSVSKYRMNESVLRGGLRFSDTTEVLCKYTNTINTRSFVNVNLFSLAIGQFVVIEI